MEESPMSIFQSVRIKISSMYEESAATGKPLWISGKREVTANVGPHSQEEL